jgi:cyclic nucleotide gated channel, plant
VSVIDPELRLSVCFPEQRLLARACDGGVRGSPGVARDEEAGGSGGLSGRSAGAPSGECYACTQPGVPAFHSTACDQVHSPDWDADAGSSLVPVQAQQQAQPAAAAAQHAARWLFGPVLDPRSKRVQRWNRWILLGRAAALALDPLFFYALSIGRAGRPCLYLDAGLAAAVTALRTCADVAHLAHVLLQFRLAYVSRESLVVGCGKLVWDARAIAAHYARSVKGLCFDLFVILPIPQVSQLPTLESTCPPNSLYHFLLTGKKPPRQINVSSVHPDAVAL